MNRDTMGDKGFNNYKVFFVTIKCLVRCQTEIDMHFRYENVY